MIVALMGKNRCGKDTIAARLVEKHGFECLSIADPIREAALDLDPVIEGTYFKGGPAHHKRLSHWVAVMGWEWCKDELPYVRHLLIHLGRQVPLIAGRPNLWFECWMDRATVKREAGVWDLVVTDMRYAREADAMRTRFPSSVVVRVVRDESTEGEDDPIDREWRSVDPDYSLRNTDTVEDLVGRVDYLAETLRGGRVLR